MKKYLFLILLMPLVHAESNIYELDREEGGIRVLCINTYVFVTTNDGDVTQMMSGKDRGKGGVGLYPVSCEKYKKEKEKIIAKSNGQ